MCFGCSKEPSHRDGSFEYPQHRFWLRNKKIISSYTLLPGGLCILFRKKYFLYTIAFRVAKIDFTHNTFSDINYGPVYKSYHLSSYLLLI